MVIPRPHIVMARETQFSMLRENREFNRTYFFVRLELYFVPIYPDPMSAEDKHVTLSTLLNLHHFPIFRLSNQPNFFLKLADNSILPAFIEVDIATWQSPPTLLGLDVSLFNEPTTLSYCSGRSFVNCH